MKTLLPTPLISPKRYLECAMKPIFILIMAVGIPISLGAYPSENSCDGCMVRLQNDTLVMGNRLTKHYYQWNNGNIIPIEFASTDGTGLSFGAKSTAMFNLPGMPIPSNARLSNEITRLSPKDDAYLKVTIDFRLDQLWVRHVISLFPDTPLLGHHFYLKGATSLQWGTRSPTGSREMIESGLTSEESKMRVGILPFKNPHWSVKAIVFQDATDHHNTLVQENNYLAYNKPVKVAGNLFFATNPTEKVCLVVMKESPLGQSQHGYEGYDLVLDQYALQVLGLGILPGDIRPQQWVRGYGYAVGITAEHAPAPLKAVRQYQKSLRTLVKERDEMVLANTWGDRSRDSRMNEPFILQEIEAAARLGITHLQLDDGWQRGLSKNSASKAGLQWDSWSREDWEPHPQRFPNGLAPLLKKATEHNVELCLWFNPSKTNDYASWERDAGILIDFYKTHGISVFKIDGIELSNKRAEQNLRNFFTKVLEVTKGEAVFNLDVTAGRRMGYYYFTEYGNIFLENRYTDWGNYYPHRTLRNTWMLSRYFPVEKLQVEFLNPWRNRQKYSNSDPLVPAHVPFDYQVAIALIAQPLAWMELSQLPEEASSLSALLKRYTPYRHKVHQGIILPIGDEPNGYRWTGFQSLVNDDEGYLMVFRENHSNNKKGLTTWLEPGEKYVFTSVLGDAGTFEAQAGKGGNLQFALSTPFSFALYHYKRVN